MKRQNASEIGAIFRSCKSTFIITGVFSLVINLLMLAGPVYMMQIYDRVIASRRLFYAYCADGACCRATLLYGSD